MKVRSVSMMIAGVACLAGMSMCSSCNDSKYEDKAKSQAVKYLSGDELLKAERFAHQQTNYDSYSGEAIEYWDSLLLDAKAKEAYVKGQQLIRDSLNKKHHRKEKFPFSLDTILPTDVVENAKIEYAKYSTAEDYIKARENAPSNMHLRYYNDRAASTHYWNLITIAGKQREAYNRGMADERAKIDSAKADSAKTTVNNNPVIKTAIEAFNSNDTRDVIDTNAKLEVYQGLAK